MNQTCHFYDVLKRVCIKVHLNMNDTNPRQIDSLHFVSGCYQGDDVTFFKSAKVGEFYDFEHEISFEIRSDEDPYMVFSYSKYNLGTDFTLFKYLSLFFMATSIVSLIMLVYWITFKLEKKTDDWNEASQGLPELNVRLDSDTELRQLERENDTE